MDEIGYYVYKKNGKKGNNFSAVSGYPSFCNIIKIGEWANSAGKDGFAIAATDPCSFISFSVNEVQSAKQLFMALRSYIKNKCTSILFNNGFFLLQIDHAIAEGDIESFSLKVEEVILHRMLSLNYEGLTEDNWRTWSNNNGDRLYVDGDCYKKPWCIVSECQVYNTKPPLSVNAIMQELAPAKQEPEKKPVPAAAKQEPEKKPVPAPAKQEPEKKPVPAPAKQEPEKKPVPAQPDSANDGVSITPTSGVYDLARFIIQKLSPLSLKIDKVREKACISLYRYHNGVWKLLTTDDMLFSISKTLIGAGVQRTVAQIKEIIENVKYNPSIALLGETVGNLVPFASHAYSLSDKKLTEHRADNWLTWSNGITLPAKRIKSLQADAPNICKWLDHVADSDDTNRARILAALYCVLINAYDWHLFIEINSLYGDTGANEFAFIASMLAGQDNTGYMSAGQLDDSRTALLAESKRLLIVKGAYKGAGDGLKAVIECEPFTVNPKHEPAYTTTAQCVVIVEKTEAVKFTNSESLAGMRVPFLFERLVPEKDKDPRLTEKIKKEIPVLAGYLLHQFPEPEAARKELLAQQNSEQALTVREQTDPLYAFCECLSTDRASLMRMGTKSHPVTNNYLYPAYLQYAKATGIPTEETLTQNAFSRRLTETMRSQRKKIVKRKSYGITVFNLKFNDRANTWLRIKEKSVEPAPKLSGAGGRV